MTALETTPIAQTISRRQIGESIGAGALGQVFCARSEGCDQVEALKLIHPRLAGIPAFQVRFREEVGAAAALYHPHIVEIFDFGEQDGQLYVAMEYFPAGSLRELLQHRSNGGLPLPLTTALDLMRQAADALAIAHAQGVLHRNLKPGNLLLATRDGVAAAPVYEMKVSDFGLARPAEELLEQPDQVGADILAYASPEWFQGQDLDARSDIYSLGVVLYEIATGYLPFEARSLNVAIQKHCFTAPPAPRGVRADLPAALETIILRCLAKAPADRFASAAELSNALVKLLRGMVLVAPPPIEPLVVSGMTSSVVAPAVRAMGARGEMVRVVALTGDGLAVGRALDNDIVLASDAVADRHLQIDWDGSRVNIVALTPSDNTLLEGVVLSPHTMYYWSLGTMLRIGPFWLRLESVMSALSHTTTAPIGPGADAASNASPPATPLDDLVAPIEMLPAQAPASAQTETTVSRISVTPDEDKLTLTPGRPAMFKVLLANLGSQVDHFTVTVDGKPGVWVVGPAPVIQLNPGKQDLVTLNVLVPLLPESRADLYPITIRARSRENQNESGTGSATWTVLPFAASKLEVRPRRAGGWRKANYTVMIGNQGNAQARYHLAGVDEEELIDCRFAKEAIDLDAGKTERIRLRAYPRQLRWFGSAQRHNFTIHSKSDREEQPQTAPARLDQRPLFPGWLLRILPVLLVALALLAYLFRLFPALDKYLWNKAPGYGYFNSPTPTVVALPALPVVLPTFPPATSLPTSAPPTLAPEPVRTPQPPPPSPKPTRVRPRPTPVPVCARNVPFKIEGDGPPGTSLLVYFDHRIVSGGITGAGHFVVSLIVGDERSGRHNVQVRTRGTSQVLTQLTCLVP